jgi:hypothetical protein
MANNTENNFSDAAGTALMAASTYRLAQMGWDSTYIQDAETARLVVQQQIDTNGWLHNIVVRYLVARCTVLRVEAGPLEL